MAEDARDAAAPDSPADPPGKPAGPQEGPDDAAGRRRGRRWLPAAAMAGAVALIASGLYTAQAVMDGDGSGERPGGGVAAEPLVLDDVPSDGAAAAEAGLPVDVSAWPNLLPPDPEPNAPEHAPVYRFGEDAAVGEDAVTELARALGLTGPVEESGGQWTVAGDEPDASRLWVQREAPGGWSYGETYGEVVPAPQPVGPDAAVGSPARSAADGAPPDRETALSAAEPVLRALGLADAQVDAAGTDGDRRVVRAVPEVAGLPVDGMETTLWIGPRGEVLDARGALSTRAVAGPEYEVAGATETLERRQRIVADWGAVECAVTGTDTEVPAGCATTAEALGTTAELGLALHYSRDEPVLVPSWLFHFARPMTGQDTLSHPAVPVTWPQSVPGDAGAGSGADAGDAGDAAEGSGHRGGGSDAAEPGEPGGGAEVEEAPGTGPSAEEPPSGGMEIISAEPDGRTLTVRFWGGVCWDYRATAEETSDRVAVEVTQAGDLPEGTSCVMMAERQTARVELAEPLGDRTVVDASGERIPVR